MSAHRSIFDLLTSLGYARTEGAGDGCCNGISLRWLEACMLDEEDMFFDRIIKIISYGSTLSNHINNVKKKKGVDLTQRDKKLLDILAFCDSVQLYQIVTAEPSLYNQPVNQHGIEERSTYASSENIIELGGMKELGCEVNIYSNDELNVYLQNLSDIIDNLELKKPIGFLLQNDNHCIGLTYLPEKGWKIMDINNYPEKSFKKEETKQLSETILEFYSSCYTIPKNGYLELATIALTTGNNPKLDQLRQQLAHFKQNHQVTAEKASRKAGDITLAHMAARFGDVEIMKELIKYKVDLNCARLDGKTPAMLAAQNGYVDIIIQLANLIDFKDDGSLVYMAGQMGHANVIKELVKHQTDLNYAAEKGTTVAHIAAIFRHVNVIQELAKHQVDFNAPGSYEYSPVFLAACLGHAEIIQEFAKHHVDLNADIKGHTPLMIAAQNGHTAVIRELAKHQVELNKSTPFSAPAAFVASQHGHLNVVLELLKIGADFDLPLNFTIASLKVRFATDNTNITQRMDDFLKEKSVKNQDFISMTCCDFAKILGRESIVKLLQPDLLNKTKSLYRSIKQLSEYGEKLINSERDLSGNNAGKKAIALANELDDLADQFINALVVSEKNKDLNAIQEKFKNKLQDGYRQMGEHRTYWKSLLANIAIAATGIGLIVILGKYIATGSTFFAETTRQKKVNELIGSLQSFELGNKGIAQNIIFGVHQKI